MMIAGVAGASGYAGGELLRLLSSHPQLAIGPITAGANAGAKVGSFHPGLASLADRVFEVTSANVLGEADVVFCALPHGESAALIAGLPTSCPVIDLGADFRLRDPVAWERFYSAPYAGAWAYGLPELPGARGQLSETTRVANPGCYATAINLALAPLLADGLIESSGIVVVAASGTSGAGRKMTENLLATEVMGSMSAYRVGGGHQHTPEVEQALGDAAGGEVCVSFTPLLAPMSRGILATCTAIPVSAATPDGLRESLVQAYAAEPFVHVLSDGQWPQTSSVLGTNNCFLQLAVDEHAGRVIVVSAIDNLGKGAAGQALQNVNILLGFPETLGLARDGLSP